MLLIFGVILVFVMVISVFVWNSSFGLSSVYLSMVVCFGLLISRFVVCDVYWLSEFDGGMLMW